MWIALLAAVSCSPCHDAIVRSFAATGMGRSITAPTAEARPAQSGRHNAQPWSVEWKDGRLTHRVAAESRAVEWAVGSGYEGKSYLHRIGDALFQSPLAWYTRRAAWDLSPGYAAEPAVDFLRPVTNDCLFCHAGASSPLPGTLNRYASPPTAIACHRCHGDGAAHARSPRRANIVNPARLDPVRRDSVCEQCHLSGAARILLPGKAFADFRPGLALEEVFSVYVPAAPKEFKVVSHAEQLARSRCATQSAGKLWCGTCHDPHTQQWRREKCQECHAQTRPHGDDCAGCHMPKQPAHDGGHTAFTDHRIRKPGPPPPAAQTTTLRAWREPAPAFRDRNLGLAYAGTGDYDKAYALLRQSAADPEAQTALGLMLLKAGHVQPALAQLEQAARAQPRHSVRRLNLAAALLAAGRRDRAAAEARAAIEIEPLLRDAYVLLAEIEPRRAAHWRAEFEKRTRQ